jgi:archaellum component FlaC
MTENKLIEKAQWKAIATNTTAHNDGVRVQSSGSQQKMADAMDRFIDVEREINELIDKLIDAKKDIISVIEKLNATEYDVLHKIYIQRMSLYEVADIKNKTYSWVTTVHGRALQSVQRILDERERNEKSI